MRRIRICNITSVLLYFTTEFRKKSDGTARAIMSFFDKFQENADGGCEDLLPNQYVTYSCADKSLITEHEVFFSPALSDLKFMVYEDTDNDTSNIVVTKQPLSN